MKIPGPDHPITVKPSNKHVRVLFNGTVVAETDKALVLQESTYAPVLYIPREDAKMGFMRPTDHTSQCPYKGTANYFSLEAGGRTADNAVWSYETPFEAVAPIVGHLAFYRNKVDAIEER